MGGIEGRGAKAVQFPQPPRFLWMKKNQAAFAEQA